MVGDGLYLMMATEPATAVQEHDHHGAGAESWLRLDRSLESPGSQRWYEVPSMLS